MVEFAQVYYIVLGVLKISITMQLKDDGVCCVCWVYRRILLLLQYDPNEFWMSLNDSLLWRFDKIESWDKTLDVFENIKIPVYS